MSSLTTRSNSFPDRSDPYWVSVFARCGLRQAAVACQFTPVGRWLVTDTDGCRCYSAGTWEPGPQLGPGVLYCVSAASRLAVLGMTDRFGFFRLAEVETGREQARTETPERYAGLATLTPDGTQLVANTKDGVNVWDLRLIRRGLRELGLD